MARLPVQKKRVKRNGVQTSTIRRNQEVGAMPSAAAGARHDPANTVAPGQSQSAKDQIARIDQISLMARTSWIGLLGYLAFIGVTLMSVSDADFFIPSRHTQLPLVNIEIPTKLLFWFAPILGASLYVYLHMQLIRLWAALAEPSPVIAGRKLQDLVYPWVVNDFALRFRSDEAVGNVPLSRLSGLVVRGLVWIAGPLILAGFWWRSMPAHDEAMTLLIAASMLVALYAGLASWWHLKNVMRRLRKNSPGQMSSHPWREPWKRRLGVIAVATILTMSWLRTEAGFEHYANVAIQGWEAISGESLFKSKSIDGEYTSREIVKYNWIKKNVITLDDLTIIINFPGSRSQVKLIPLAHANLNGINAENKPKDWRDYEKQERVFRETWCKRQDIDIEMCGQTIGKFGPVQPRLERLKNTWCSEHGRSVESCANYFRDLNEAFREAWDHEWYLTISALDSIDLSGRDLRGADLVGAFLVNSDLSGARLDGANFTSARLEGANFYKTRLYSADFSRARLDMADLSEAIIQWSLFFDSHLERADLTRAQLSNVTLRRTRLDAARLGETNFRYTDLKDASLVAADLRFADISTTHDLNQEALNSAYGNQKTKLPEKLEHPCHWDKEKSYKYTTYISRDRSYSYLAYMYDIKYEDWLSAGAPPDGPCG